MFTFGQMILSIADGSANPGTPGNTVQPGLWEQLSGMLMLIVPMGLFFYFFMIRPESKKRKEREQLLNSVKVKDKVTTIGGIHGTVVDIEPNEIVLLVDQKKDVKMRFRRSAIDSVGSAENGEKK